MSTDNDTAQIAFRELARFVGYRFGDDGSVWSQWTWKIHLYGHLRHGYVLGDWRTLKPRPNERGYLRVQLKSAEGLPPKDYYVHTLIMEAFRGPCPDRMEVRHMDGDNSNNRLDNLCYGTRKQNHADKHRHGTQPMGENHTSSKLDWPKVRFARRAADHGVRHRVIAGVLGVRRATITDVVQFKSWKPRHLRLGDPCCKINY